LRLPLAHLEWHAPFLSGGGYSSEALTFVQGLLLLNRTAADASDAAAADDADEGAARWAPLRLRLEQHGDGVSDHFVAGLDPALVDELVPLFPQGRFASSSSKGAVVVCHSEPGAWAPALFKTSACPPRGDYGAPALVIGRTMFETDRVTAEHVRRCNRMDEVWVPSAFHMRTFAASGVRPDKLRKIVQAVDTSFYSPHRDDLEPFRLPFGKRLVRSSSDTKSRSRKRFSFLSVFKWEPRKGWDVLVRAYLAEFSAADDVALYLLTNKYHVEDAEMQARLEGVLATVPEPPEGYAALFLADTHVPLPRLPALYRAVDAFVLPSRGEGWGRPHVEAMAMGLPVIATNWSGTTEYLSEAVGYPLRVAELATVGEGSFFSGHKWASPCSEHLQQLMRHVVHNPAEAAQKGKAARALMASTYSLEAVARTVADALIDASRAKQEREASSRTPRSQSTRRPRDATEL